jgi:aminoglycoside 6'-N-acetyltransferase I
MTIRPLQVKTDRAEWLRMRLTLWPECSPAIHQLEMNQQVDPDRAAVFVVDRGDGKLGGFAEVLIKSWAEGCHSGRVAYLEGWIVDEDLRGQGWGGKLINEVENWARAKSCTEFASDTWIDNEQSHQAHLKLGFTEFMRLTHYRKEL